MNNLTECAQGYPIFFSVVLDIGQCADKIIAKVKLIKEFYIVFGLINSALQDLKN